MPKNEPTLSIDRFRGINNVERPSRLEPGWLAGADNMSLDDEGGLESRQGYTAIAGFTAITSAYATRDQTRLYVVDNGDLKRVVSMQPLVTAVLASGLPSGEVYWCEAGNMVLFSGAAQGVIDGGDYYPLSIPMAPSPGLTQIDGQLPGGRYRVACTFKDARGREGGSGPAGVIDVADDSGISMILPSLADHTVIVYVSSVNGETLYRLDEDTGGGFVWVDQSPSTFPLNEEQVVAYPAPANADLIAFHESKLWVSDYDQSTDLSYLFHSKPFWYHLFDLSRDYVAIPGKVLMLASVPGGLIIGTNREIYVYTVEEALVKLADYGVVPGHNVAYQQNGNVVFWTQRGVCSGLPFKNHTDETYSVPHGARVGVQLIEKQGKNQFIVVAASGGNANNPYEA